MIEGRKVSKEEFNKFLLDSPDLKKYSNILCDPPYIMYYKEEGIGLAREWFQKGWPKPDWSTTKAVYEENEYEIFD